jgi:acetolactate synthase-1/2/3 large subunit
MKYSDQIASWLVELGYDCCFFVGGGNIMHLIESIDRKIACHAVVHEVAAGIAAEYYNETSLSGRAFALVTAGPGLTNIVTAIAGAFLESRELLVIGGQVKTSDLSRGLVRQRGIQEIDGVSLASAVCKASRLMIEPLDFEEFRNLVQNSNKDRKGPVFVEIPLDIQAREYVDKSGTRTRQVLDPSPTTSDAEVAKVARLVREARRPLLLLGGGFGRSEANKVISHFERHAIPVATTWNGADRIGCESPVYMGRPNTWGQRSANLVLQQADVLIAIGTRLGLQQTGFNWQQFVPNGNIVQVDVDPAELTKGHPHVKHPIRADANDFVTKLATHDLGSHADWLAYAQEVRNTIPLVENVNNTREGYLSPYIFADTLADQCNAADIIIPCSSGGAFTVMMQTFRQKSGQIIVTNHGLASMGYGLSGAIGAAFANPGRRVVLVEGDGGFAQTMQEVGTVQVNDLHIKMFIFDDAGYASIRMTQKSYFDGHYVGCDIKTGLGLPNWEKLFGAWNIPVCRISPGFIDDRHFSELFSSQGPAAFIVSIDPEQSYFPKITSQVTQAGTMVSNPLHQMTPDLPTEILAKVGRYLPAN